MQKKKANQKSSLIGQEFLDFHRELALKYATHPEVLKDINDLVSKLSNWYIFATISAVAEKYKKNKPLIPGK